MSKHFSRICAALLVLLLCVLTFSACSQTPTPESGEKLASVQQTQAVSGVNSVLLNSRGAKITVRAMLDAEYTEAHQKETVYLFELPAGADPSSLNAYTPVESFRVTPKYTYTVALTEESVTRLYCSYQLAASDGAGGYTPIGSPVAVLNPETLATHTFAYPTALSIKGLESDSVSSALSLGVSHTVLDIAIEDYFVTYPDTVNISTVDYISNGISYHFSEKALTDLDTRVKALSDEGIIVYFRFVLNTPATALPAQLSCLGYADAPAGAEHYAVNIFNPGAAGYMTAMFEFFASRYASRSAATGFCGSFIIGDDVNLPSVSNSAGTADTESYCSSYAGLVRLAHTALVSNYSGGRVYISLARNWNAEPGTGNAADSSSGAFLANFNALTQSSGDYNWAVAASAYPLDLTDSSIWDDALSTGASSQYLSPANINVLTYALSKGFTFGDTARRVIICAFGVSGDPYDTASQNEQAASYAYSYYKVAGDDGVDALIYCTLCDDPVLDTPAETAKKAPSFGLAAAGSNGSPSTKKALWEVFRSIDTDRDESAVTAATLCGSEFSYLYSNLSPTVKIRKLCTGEGFAASGLDSYRLTSLFRFTGGSLSGFTASEPGTLLDLSMSGTSPALHIFGNGALAVSRANIGGSFLSDTEYLVFNIAGSSSDGTMTLRLSANGRGTPLVYESTAAYTAGSSLISFNISEFTKLIKTNNISLSLRVVPNTGQNNAELFISTISIADRGVTASSVLWIILIAIIVLLVLLLCISLFTRAVHRSRRRRARRNRAAQPAQTAVVPKDNEE